MKRTSGFGLALVGVAVLAAPRPGATIQGQTPPGDLVVRARAYVERFVGSFTNVVAEEVYVQERALRKQRRELTSDFYLVRPAGATGWTQLRDVFAVDGRPVRDRETRLARLIQDPGSGDWLSRAMAFAQESARYNIADIGSFNLPLNGLGFLQAEYSGHFEFTPRNVDPAVAPRARVVQFRERTPPLYAGRPLTGRFWIDEASAAVLKTEITIGGGLFASQTATTFVWDRELGLWRPQEMRERYPLSGGDVVGVATYGRFRTFAVSSRETFERVGEPRP